jgi:hypothetical protein
MKNKRLLVILIIFVFLTLVIVLSSTVFTVSNIEIKWLVQPQRFNKSDEAVIIESAEFKRGESVFLFDKERYITKLETNNPYLMVKGIEIVFPNSIVLHVAERQVEYALKVTNAQQPSSFNYVFLDDELKVLEISTLPIIPSSTSFNVLEVINMPLSDADFTIGTFAEQLLVNDVLTELAFAAKVSGYNSINFRAFVKNIILEFGTRSELTIYTNWGINIVINDATHRLTEKIIFGISTYNELHDAPAPVVSGTIEVFETAEGNIEASHYY